jgi:hypothetical protein
MERNSRARRSLSIGNATVAEWARQRRQTAQITWMGIKFQREERRRMILSDQETTLLQHLIDADGGIQRYSDARQVLTDWRTHRWTKAQLRKSIRELVEKRLAEREPFGKLAVTESGIAALKSL